MDPEGFEPSGASLPNDDHHPSGPTALVIQLQPNNHRTKIKLREDKEDGEKEELLFSC